MDDSDFLKLADFLYQKIEQSIDDAQGSIECEINDSLLTLEFEDETKFIINRQQPLHQIWLATLTSGHHYDYINGLWIDNRNGEEFLSALSCAILKQSSEVINFDSP